MSNKHEGEYITIGKFYIEWDSEGKLWIGLSDDSGEGGEFNADELEKVIGEFYAENF
jgi:hypothetical protein